VTVQLVRFAIQSQPGFLIKLTLLSEKIVEHPNESTCIFRVIELFVEKIGTISGL
jgi:hypothetical protein